MTRIALVAIILAGCAAPRSAQEAIPTVTPRSQYDGAALPSSESPGRTGQPDSHPGAPNGPRPGRTMPTLSAVTGSGPEPTRRPAAASPLRGIATWFKSPAGVSAAGPALRRALGPGWRGTRVRVCVGGRCAVTVLGDWCACGPRRGGPTVIDLHAPLFARLAPLSRGVLTVTVEEA